MQYYRQMDGLRALAVCFVLLGHAIPSVYAYHHPSMAVAGVRLFFVISGFLITGIILRMKEQLGPRQLLLKFFGRRALRIFPPYYLLLLVLWVADVGSFRETSAWHALYLSNVLAVRQEGLTLSPVGHLWSLSVEEQFYLVWPFLLLLFRGRGLVGIILLIMASSVGFKMWASLANWHTAPYVMMFSNTETLGAGALLACAVHHGRGDWVVRVQRSMPWCFLLFAGLQAVHAFTPLGFLRAWLESLTCAGLFAGLVALAYTGSKGWIGRLLELRALRYTGKISYGIYLYHLPVLLLLRRVVAAHSESVFIGISVLSIAVTLVLAHLSWQYIEKPINGLKDRGRLRYDG